MCIAAIRMEFPFLLSKFFKDPTLPCWAWNTRAQRKGGKKLGKSRKKIPKKKTNKNKKYKDKMEKTKAKKK